MACLLRLLKHRHSRCGYSVNGKLDEGVDWGTRAEWGCFRRRPKKISRRNSVAGNAGILKSRFGCQAWETTFRGSHSKAAAYHDVVEFLALAHLLGFDEKKA